MNIQRYKAYKDSGVDWLGEIPANWKIKRLKYIVKILKRIIGFEGPQVLSITQQGIKIKDVSSGEGQLAMDYSKYQIVKKGDFAMNHMDLLTGYVDIASVDGVTSPDYRVFKKTDNSVDADYLLLLFQMCYQQKIFFAHGQGVSKLGRWRFPAENFENFVIPIPSFQEQKVIVNFIKNQQLKIDQAIALKEQLIARLKERKQIIIQHAVTKGLDPDAPLKDSGVEWIGEIPAHWEVKKFRYSFSLDKGLSITKENLKETGVRCINYGELHSKYGFEINPQKHPLKCVDRSFLHSSPKSLLSYGDFIFADTSEDLEGSGNFSYLNSKEFIFSGYHTVIARIKLNLNPRFVAYLFDSEIFRNQLRKKVKGVKVFSITQSILNDLLLWFPEKNEQNRIVSLLDTQSQKIDTAITQQQTQIDHLKEYKATLIDSAVTGKINVC